MCFCEQKVPCCSLCGHRGHLARTCPNRHCSNCLLPGHTFNECLERAYWHKRCHRCGMAGHFNDVSSALCVLGCRLKKNVCAKSKVFIILYSGALCVRVCISWAIPSLIKTDASQAVSGTHAPLVTPQQQPHRERHRNGGGKEKQVEM